MKSQESETADSKTLISIDDSYTFDDPQLYITNLFSPFEKKYYHQQKEELETELITLKDQVSVLISKRNSKNQYVPKGELFQLKYQIIDSFYAQNIPSYADMIHSYIQICIENTELKQKIIFYEKEIENQFNIRNSLIEENDQIKLLFDFTDLPNFSYPKLTNAQFQNFTKIDLSEIESENEYDYNLSDYSSISTKYKSHADFFIEKIHEQISWEENTLNRLKNEISKFDMLLDTYNESQKRNAANTISTAQQTMSKKNQISSQALKLTIDDIQKLYEDSEKAVIELERQNEQLRQKKVKNQLDYQNKKAHLKMLRQSSLECYKKQLAEMKNKSKHLRRLINSKADEYDANCESLMTVFNNFDQKINGRKEEIQNVWNNKAETTKIEEEEEEKEDEEIIEIYFNDPSQTVLLNELEKKRNDLLNDIKMMEKQLKRMIISANYRYDNLLSRVKHLQNKEEKIQNLISFELAKMEKLPQNKSYKYVDKIDASMLKLNLLLENS